MQTPKHKTNTTDNSSPSISLPDVAQVAGKGNFANLKMILVGISFVVVLVGYSYHVYSSKYKNEKPKKSLESQDIISKNWVLGSVKQTLAEEPRTDDTAVTEKPFPAHKKQISKDKPIFKRRSKSFAKYKFIPTNSSSSAYDESSKSESGYGESDAEVVIAESLTIDPDFLLQEGTYIPCSLTMRFVSEVAGRIQCLINQDIYGASGRVKLIERGTKAIGVYQSGTLGYGMARMHVIWTKLLTPDHKRVNLVDSHVVGSLGEAGIDGKVNSHFAQRFGGALMVSLIKDVVAGVSAKHSGKARKNTINITKLTL